VGYRSRSAALAAEWKNEVVNAFSALRTDLCEDMNSRRGPRLRSGEERDMDLEIRIEAQAETS
jgi:hypothetical protein